jgi:hypothetical protein
MPDVRSANWDNVRLKCTVIADVMPNIISIQVDKYDEREFGFNDELIHWDSIGLKVLIINGSQIMLRKSFIPSDLQKANRVFWLTITNEGNWQLYRNFSDEKPERNVRLSEAT